MKKILFIYPSMMIGGSTTALLSLLNCLSPEKYEIDLQLFRNEGPLLDAIPPHVKLLPQAEVYTGTRGRAIKLSRFVFLGYAFRSFAVGITGNKKKLFSRGVANDFQAKSLSRKNDVEYDYAIGYLEGWSNRYLAYSVKAKKKYAWLHSTFQNITSEPREELSWMKRVDKIVFVADQPCNAFREEVPEMADKAIAIENITDSEVIRKRSLAVDYSDEAYEKFIASDLFKIITVCRLTISVKGLDRIVACAEKLKSSGKRFLWYIIGDGEDMAKLKELVDAADVADRLIPIGKRMNPYPFIAAADIMCMPSRYEGKPVTVTESLILATPPVVTEYLSANEQIRSGVDGIVVENNDTSIFDAVNTCISESSVVLEMTENAKKTEYGNREYIRVFENLLL